MKPSIKFHSTHSGFCRLYFKGQKGGLYALQASFRNKQTGKWDFELHTCTRDGEPDCPVRLDAVSLAGIPTDSNEQIINEALEFLGVQP